MKFIRSRCERDGISPSFREIQEHFGYKAVGTVQDHVKALIRKGWLEKPTDKKARKARGLLPTGHARENVKRISIYGEIAAGATREADQIELGGLVISEVAAKDPCFALRVVGDSMIEVGILEGDFLIVEKGARVKNGDIVVALWNGETTVKRYVEKAGAVYLVPENSRMKPLAVTGGSFEIQGKVVGLQRKI